MYLLLYTGLLLNSFLIEQLILVYISKYFSNIYLLLTKGFIYLLFLSKYLAYAFVWGSFTNNSDGKASLPLCLYPIKYLN